MMFGIKAVATTFSKTNCSSTKFLRHCSTIRFNESNHKKNENYKRNFSLHYTLSLSIAGFIFYKYYNNKQSFLKCIKDFTFVPKVLASEVNRNNLFKSDNKAPPRVLFNFLADVAEKTSPSVVYIEIAARHPITRKDMPVSNGSGFIVKPDGLILTNAHVVSHYGRVIVKLFDGKEYEGTVEHIDTETDLATVRIKANDLPVLPLGQSANLRPGEFVIAMGNPLTLSHTITAGVISSANRQGKDLGLHRKSDYIQTDAAVNVGNSGGPLVNLDGEAIGINTMKVTEGISFAIPSDRAVEFLKRIEDNKQSSWNPFAKPANVNRKKYLGITMLTLNPTIVQELKERNPDFPNVTHGIMVWRVMIDSPSYVSGIRHGDIITSINGKEIYSAADVYKFLQSEDTLKIHVLRDRREFDVHVELLDPVYP